MRGRFQEKRNGTAKRDFKTMATRDTKRIERLIALSQEKVNLLREEITQGASFQMEYEGEQAEVQKYGSRLVELREHNARAEQSEQNAPVAS